MSRGCLGGGRPGTAPRELALGPSASAAPAAGPRLPWRSEPTGPEALLFWFVLSAWTTCLWGFLFFHGQVQNHGQGSPGTPRAAAGRRLSSPASFCTPWHQGTRGLCAVRVGAASPLDGRYPLVRPVWVVATQCHERCCDEHLRVSLTCVFGSDSSKRPRGAVANGCMGPVCRPCFLRALPVVGVSNL